MEQQKGPPKRAFRHACEQRLFGALLSRSLLGSDLLSGNLGSSLSSGLGVGSSLFLGSDSSLALSLGGSLLGILLGALCLLGSLGLLLSLALLLSLGNLGSALGLLGSLALGNELVGSTELVGEALHASAGVDELLLTGVERVAGVTDFNANLGLRRTRLERVAAAARHRALDVIRMDSFFHFLSFSSLVSDQGLRQAFA